MNFTYPFDNTSATFYYLPGTTGWSATFAGRPTALWALPYPLILNNDSRFGIQTNGLSFIISWANATTVVAEASTNLANAAWVPLQSLNLTNGAFYFSDPAWTNFSPPVSTASARRRRLDFAQNEDCWASGQRIMESNGKSPCG